MGRETDEHLDERAPECPDVCRFLVGLPIPRPQFARQDLWSGIQEGSTEVEDDIRGHIASESVDGQITDQAKVRKFDTVGNGYEEVGS